MQLSLQQESMPVPQHSRNGRVGIAPAEAPLQIAPVAHLTTCHRDAPPKLRVGFVTSHRRVPSFMINFS